MGVVVHACTFMHASVCVLADRSLRAWCVFNMPIRMQTLHTCEPALKRALQTVSFSGLASPICAGEPRATALPRQNLLCRPIPLLCLGRGPTTNRSRPALKRLATVQRLQGGGPFSLCLRGKERNNGWAPEGARQTWLHLLHMSPTTWQR